MKPGRKIVFAGGIAAALLLLWLIQREYGRLAAGRDRLRELNRAMAAVQSESARQQAALAAFVPPAQPAASVAPFAAPAQSAAPAWARAASRPWLSRLFAESPYLHRLYLEAYRSDLEFAHALTFARLGLTPEARAAVVAILTRDMARRSDLAAAARAGNMPSTDGSIKTLDKQREREREAALRQALGGRQYAPFREMGQPMMPVVSEAAMQLQRTGTPLTLEQTEALHELIQQNLFGRWVAGVHAFPTEADYEVIARQAGQFLSPGQGEVVRALIEQEMARRKLNQLQSPKRK